jgi:hypothetical protein
MSAPPPPIFGYSKLTLFSPLFVSLDKPGCNFYGKLLDDSTLETFMGVKMLNSNNAFIFLCRTDDGPLNCKAFKKSKS